jgi:hypothetical protein
MSSTAQPGEPYCTPDGDCVSTREPPYCDEDGDPSTLPPFASTAVDALLIWTQGVQSRRMSLGSYEEDTSQLYATIRSMTPLFGLSAPHLHFDASVDGLGTLSVVTLQVANASEILQDAAFSFVPISTFVTLTGGTRVDGALRFGSGRTVPHDGSPTPVVTVQSHVDQVITLPHINRGSMTITALPPAGTFYDGAIQIRLAALPHQLSGATVIMRFDNVDGLAAAADETNDVVRQSVATGVVEYAIMDSNGLLHRRSLRMRVLQSDLTCTEPGYAVTYEGTTPGCQPCPKGQTTSLGSAVCDICAQHFFRMSVQSPVTECFPCPDQNVARCDGLDTTLATIAIAPGWWRVSNRTQELHWSVKQVQPTCV